VKRSILVVEDERALGRMLVDNLEEAGYRVELVVRGDLAVTRLGRGGVELVILDLMLPGRSGFEVLEHLRQRGIDTPVLVLSALADHGDRIRALERQADDYLTKPFHLDELLLRVAALLRRRPVLVPEAETLEFGGHRVDLAAHAATLRSGDSLELSPTEVRLLRLLAGQPGTVIPREEIVAHLFGPHTPVKVRTLDNLVARLRKAFERDSRHPEYLHTVRGVGLRFTP